MKNILCEIIIIKSWENIISNVLYRILCYMEMKDGLYESNEQIKCLWNVDMEENKKNSWV